jgi:hypothetical protein
MSTASDGSQRVGRRRASGQELNGTARRWMLTALAGGGKLIVDLAHQELAQGNLGGHADDQEHHRDEQNQLRGQLSTQRRGEETPWAMVVREQRATSPA